MTSVGGHPKNSVYPKLLVSDPNNFLLVSNGDHPKNNIKPKLMVSFLYNFL